MSLKSASGSLCLISDSSIPSIQSPPSQFNSSRPDPGQHDPLDLDPDVSGDPGQHDPLEPNRPDPLDPDPDDPGDPGDPDHPDHSGHDDPGDASNIPGMRSSEPLEANGS